MTDLPLPILAFFGLGSQLFEQTCSRMTMGDAEAGLDDRPVGPSTHVLS